ncbi:sulfatase-like hydrolase/transferase [Halomonas sp. TRM85114]|uniref:sulfatase-like hydrolase/transferase n=1 Tax=Halomonas jincaotanensis TaxID=2810616 RepID=UPI001BD4B3C9|nr:sulfatase-like hydrolase/transferase [Halomonas jincaotanensis]MBS9403383.1 sulfatase-like hydrolase/transferase [Halomonas jincaotanensis]
MPLPAIFSCARQPRWWALLIIGSWIAHSVATLSLLPPWTMVPVLAGWLGLGWLFRWGAPRRPREPTRVWPWSLLPIAIGGLYVYLADSFGDVDLGAVFFHLQAGMEDHGGADRNIAAVLYTFSMVLLLIAFTWLIRVDHRWRLSERPLALLLLASNPLFYGVGQRSASIVTDDGAWLERRYVAPVINEAPADPPNLLLLYLESIERTYADTERFGDAYADLAALGQRARVFEGIQQLDNTGWTMAGMIATQCGAPLMPAGLLHDSQFEPLGKVVPGVDCLGDLLDEQGYHLTYMGGASTAFAGKGIFYEDHGFDRVMGREELSPRLDDPDYLNNWGLYDDTLYDITVEEVRQLSQGEAPWAIVNLSLTGHAPEGYPARRCEQRQGDYDGIDILYSVKCSAWLARDLIDRLEDEGLLENTLVVIASDHLTMRVSAWEQLVSGERYNTFMLLGNDVPPGNVDRSASTLDVFPTILEAMSFEIDEHRAGLGVSLLSPYPTLVEQHGVENVNTRMREETALQNRLWEGLVPEQQHDEEASTTEQVVETPEDATGEQPADVQ